MLFISAFLKLFEMIKHVEVRCFMNTCMVCNDIWYVIRPARIFPCLTTSSNFWPLGGTKTSLESLVGLEPNLNFYDISNKQKEMYRDIISTESAPRKMDLNPSHVPGLSPMVELCLAESSSMCSATHAGGQAQPLVVLKLACNRVFCQVHKSFWGRVFNEFDKGECISLFTTKVLFQDPVDTSSTSQSSLRSMAGNGMSLPCAGFTLLMALLCVEDC